MSIKDAGQTMTEPSHPHQGIAEAIRALRHDILAAGRKLDWDVVRGRIRRLLIERRPSPDERIELLELYDQVATRVERLRAGDIGSLRRLRHQRAADTLRFVFVEARHEGALSFETIVDRELVAGRLRVDPYLSEILGELLRVFDAGGGGSPGVGEDGAAFSFPRVQPPTRQPAFSAMAVKNSGS